MTGVLKKPTRKPGPAPGTTITREWHGRRIEVRAVEGGFQWDGAVYKSLSAVAKAVTGAHWNGRLFFFGRRTKGSRA